MNRAFILIFLSLITFSKIEAQSADLQSDTLPKCPLCKNGIHLNENPYQLGFKAELPYLITAAGTLGLGQLIQATNGTKPFTEAQIDQLDRNNINTFDRPATYNWDPEAQNKSDFLRTAVIILPVVFLANHHTKEDFGPLVVMSLEVGAITYGLTTATKNLVNRTRPFAYNENVSLDEKTKINARLSFFSGHASFTAAFSIFFAKVLSDYHPNMKTGYKIALWSFSSVIPVTTGFLRVKAGKHFPTDVITGVAVGAAVGWLVPELHKKHSFSKNLSILPQFNYGATGGYISYRF